MQDSPALVMDAKTPTGTGEILNFCLHLALEEGAMEEEHVCPFCETTWLQRLRANVEQHVSQFTRDHHSVWNKSAAVQ